MADDCWWWLPTINDSEWWSKMAWWMFNDGSSSFTIYWLSPWLWQMVHSWCESGGSWWPGRYADRDGGEFLGFWRFLFDDDGCMVQNSPRENLRFKRVKNRGRAKSQSRIPQDGLEWWWLIGQMITEASWRFIGTWWQRRFNSEKKWWTTQFVAVIDGEVVNND